MSFLLSLSSSSREKQNQFVFLVSMLTKIINVKPVHLVTSVLIVTERNAQKDKNQLKGMVQLHVLYALLENITLARQQLCVFLAQQELTTTCLELVNVHNVLLVLTTKSQVSLNATTVQLVILAQQKRNHSANLVLTANLKRKVALSVLLAIHNLTQEWIIAKNAKREPTQLKKVKPLATLALKVMSARTSTNARLPANQEDIREQSELALNARNARRLPFTTVGLVKIT